VRTAAERVRTAGVELTPADEKAALETLRVQFEKAVRERFAKSYVRKPKASRDRSREVFLVGKSLLAASGGPEGVE